MALTIFVRHCCQGVAVAFQNSGAWQTLVNVSCRVLGYCGTQWLAEHMHCCLLKTLYLQVIFASVIEDKMERSIYLTAFSSRALEDIVGETCLKFVCLS